MSSQLNNMNLLFIDYVILYETLSTASQERSGKEALGAGANLSLME